MCGINGILRLHAGAPAIDRDEALRTREQMRARGPDGAGLWLDGRGQVALASRRLAILDLSPLADQPMRSADGRYHLVLNGEIYNFRSLRDQLRSAGARFPSTGDTAVVLAAWAHWGVAMLPRLRGMYGLAIWDEQERSLLLARDPYGIKPLYYALADGVLRFASQVEALIAGGAVSREIDLGALGGFLVWGSVPEPLTFRAAVRALPAGHYLVARDGQLGEPRRHYFPAPEPPPDAALGRGRERGRAGTGHGGEEEQDPTPAASLASAFAEAVDAHLVSDVPLAVFLSGGLDSALVAALARRSLADLATLTVRFPQLLGTPADEGPPAARLARSFGTRHHELTLTSEQLRAAWPATVAAMDQPSIDGVNTFLIARAAREAGFTVVLSGLGGDELLGGYPSFRDLPRMVRFARAARLVPGLRPLWPRLVAGARPKAAGVLRYGATLAGAYLLRRGLFLPEELPALLGPDATEEALRRYDPLADAAAALAEPGVDPLLPPASGRSRAHGGDPWLAVHQLESTRYLRHQLLRDSDWAAMASSVELRVPLVDPFLRAAVAAAGFAPARRGGKRALVGAIVPELPRQLLRRPKSGFYVPLVEALEPRAVATHGGRSRALALRVLRERGVELPGARIARAGGPIAAL